MENDYTIDCTGDCCVGDVIIFERAMFSESKKGFRGRFIPGKFLGMETIEGKIIKDSYGKDKQQHTFTLETSSGITLIKGRNLYRNGCKRKSWMNEEERKIVIDEKHKRGQQARSNAAERKSNKEWRKEQYA